ncbi:MAG: DUF2723 domain-containing protein [Bacteroidales bacterium]|nr:DUF2723 domain-containing protein [Bacteroidales bacterium]
MENFKKLNVLIGWLTFLLSTVVYLLTIEPTASWWDCGEYIATAYKMQVGHPPGAPFFQMLGRIFSLFAFGDQTKVALMINSMSAISSGLTIMFLFWSITALAQKIFAKTKENITANMYAILGAGFIGAMAYTFTDSFWFSAVEGEVYAMSSFFTAVTFWAALKWEQVADEANAYRWLILIAYLIGVSIGVHLLNLLAIPAVAYVFYFKRFKPDLKGLIVTGIISVFILAFVMYGVIPEIVNLFGKTELHFVNNFGLPFTSGTVFFTLVMIATITLGILYTENKLGKNGKYALYGSLGILALLILTSYSSGSNFFFRLLMIGTVGAGVYYIRDRRLELNTILLSLTFLLIGYSSFLMIVIRANANPPINENNPKDAVSLLSYLNREQYGSTPLFSGPYYNTPMVDMSDKSPFYIKDSKKGEYVIADDGKNQIPVYDKSMTTIFPRMWSNQRSSHPGAYKQWGQIKGTPVSVTDREGNPETIMKPTFGENLRFFFKYQVGHMYLRYFMWNFVGRQNDIQGHGGLENGNWKSGINFIDQAIVGTQDNLPGSMQNAANNSFLFLPLILGLIGLFFHLSRKPEDALVVFMLFFMTGLAIVIYLNQYPYQPRERDYAFAGSFYAFAIWIGIGVLSLYEMFRKGINPKMAAIGATTLCLVVPGILGAEGWDDHDRSGKYVARDMAFNYLESCDQNSILFTFGDNDTFPLWYAQEVEGKRTDIRVVNHMLASGDWYIHQMHNKVYDAEKLPLTLRSDQYTKGTNDRVYVIDRGLKGYRDLKEIIDFVASDDPATMLPPGFGYEGNYIPTRKVRLYVDKQKVLDNGIVPPEMADRIVDYIDWDIKSNVLIKNDLMLLDLLATNNWERPIYFASVNSDILNAANLDKYLHQEGFVYKFMPVLADAYIPNMGGVSEKSYDVLMNRCVWGNMEDLSVTMDTETKRTSPMTRNYFMRTALYLADLGKLDSAEAIVDKRFEVFPKEHFVYDRYTMPFVEVYYRCGAIDKANAMVKDMTDIWEQKLGYYNSQNDSHLKYYEDSVIEALSALNNLYQITQENKQVELAAEVRQKLDFYLESLR